MISRDNRMLNFKSNINFHFSLQEKFTLNSVDEETYFAYISIQIAFDFCKPKIEENKYFQTMKLKEEI